MQEDVPQGSIDSEASVTQATYEEGERKIAAEGEYRFDFGDGAVAEGYIGDDLIRSDYALVDNGTFQIDLPNGDYDVALIAGDQEESSEIAIKTERMRLVVILS